ncbi:hypothetical protein J4558_11650 [Leptolyngbya sp. 15MV]|nr:hypothetical protein J4558_11650 [Leptolyngbya sp. 15MV]
MQAVPLPAGEFLVRWMGGKTQEAYDALLDAWGGEAEPVWTRPWLTHPESYYVALPTAELEAIKERSIQENRELIGFLMALRRRADVAVAGADPAAPSRERVRAEAQAVRRAGLTLTDETRRSKFAVLNGRAMIRYADQVLQRLDAP